MTGKTKKTVMAQSHLIYQEKEAHLAGLSKH
jgi:hypothetical protein